MHRLQIGVNGRDRIGLRLESAQLRVVSVAPGLAEQHFAREQGFTPQRDQTNGIEITGMQGPDSHGMSPSGRTGSHGKRRTNAHDSNRNRGTLESRP